MSFWRHNSKPRSVIVNKIIFIVCMQSMPDFVNHQWIAHSDRAHRMMCVDGQPLHNFVTNFWTRTIS